MKTKKYARIYTVMKKLFFVTLLFGQFSSSAQFTVYNPPVVFSISDIECNSTLGKVVVASDSGVFFFDGTNWTQTTTVDGLPSDDVKCLNSNSAGAVLVSTASGLAKWNGTSWSAYALSTTQTFSYVAAIYIALSTDTFYGTDNGKLLRKGAAAAAANIGFTPAIGTFTDIGHMAPGAYDFIIGTSSNGAVIFDAPLSQYFIVSTASTPIPSNNILSHSIEGNISYDGTDQGVYIPDFTNFPSVPSVIYNTGNSPLPSNIIQAIAVRNGVQWYGTPNGLAMHQNTTWTVYNTANSNLPNDNVVELSYDTIGNVLWIGTADGKLSKLISPSSTNDIISEDDIVISPNPVIADVSITLPHRENASLKIYDMSGRLLVAEPIDSGNKTINLSRYAAGIYVAEILFGDMKLMKKIIKQ